MLPAVSVNKGCCSYQANILQLPLTVSPEGTQDGNRMLVNKQSAAAATPPRVHPEETQDEKAQDTGPRKLRSTSKE